MNGKLTLSQAHDLVGLDDPAALLLRDVRKPTTRRAYAAGLRHFFTLAGYVNPDGGPDPHPSHVRAFLARSPPQIALQLAQYSTQMRAAGLSPATINARLAAVRSLLKMSYRLGLSQTDGRGLVDGERPEAYRDTRGTDLRNIKRLLALPDRRTLRGKRDAAMLRLLCTAALRRAELCALDVSDFDPAEGTLLVLGKGKSQRKAITLPPGCISALRSYLSAAKHADGPLFRNVARRYTLADPARAAGRLTPDGLYKIVADYGQKLGLRLTPHKLRHSAITIFLDSSGGNILEAQGLSRHADLRTLSIYDDNRHDRGGRAIAALDELLGD